MIPNRFVILWNQQPVGLDSNSGGYPFHTDNPNLIHYFIDKEGAEHYIDVMTMRGRSEMYSDMRVVEIQFKIMDSK